MLTKNTHTLNTVTEVVVHRHMLTPSEQYISLVERTPSLYCKPSSVIKSVTGLYRLHVQTTSVE